MRGKLAAEIPATSATARTVSALVEHLDDLRREDRFQVLNIGVGIAEIAKHVPLPRVSLNLVLNEVLLESSIRQTIRSAVEDVDHAPLDGRE